jgi:hypothetical protein
MYVFVNTSGQALVALNRNSARTVLSLPELDTRMTAIATAIRVTPKPIVSVVSTLGGQNFINVFGEDPLQVEISGILVGSNCQSGEAVSNAVSNGVDFYKQNSVINRITPITFRFQSEQNNPAVPKATKGFLVAMTISQEAEFQDIANFNLLIISQSLDSRELAKTPAVITSPIPSPIFQSRGVSTNLMASSSGAMPSVDWGGSILIDSNGEVVSSVATQIIQV